MDTRLRFFEPEIVGGAALGWPAAGKDDHEGDWERICVWLDSNNRATEVAYYQHEGHKILPWSKVTKEGLTHPVVYSAKGSVVREDWDGYGGGWGEARDNKETTGPQGPSRFKKPAPDGW
jgi:hypothetical protein